MTQSSYDEIDYMHHPIQLKPVGIVRNQNRNSGWSASSSSMSWQERTARMKAHVQAISELAINSELVGILDGIDDFSHLVVLYWAHLIPDKSRSVRRVHPLGSKDFPLVGVFATHSPIRPNCILSTVVKLVGRKGNTLKVTGLDALDGSLILDIKPYIPYHEDFTDVKMPEWMRRIHDGFS